MRFDVPTIRSVALLIAILASIPLSLVWTAGQLDADDRLWNQYRGPDGNGHSAANGLPTQFAEKSKSILWKVPVPGRGWSSPVVWGQTVWLTTGPEIQNLKDGEKALPNPLVLSLLAFDLKTGAQLSKLDLFEVLSPQFTHPTNSYASPTPYVEEGRIYVHFGTYGTACIDTDTSKTLWERRDLECDHFRGPGSSVAVYGDLVYLTFDGFDYQYLIALNKHTGETVWKQDRAVDFGTTDGDAMKAYSTPVLIDHAGRKQLISSFASATIAYAPESGKPLWTVHHGGMNSAVRPVFNDRFVFLNSADGPDPLLAVPLDGEGDITSRIAWRTGKAVPRRPSQILVNDLLFMVSDGGIATCLEANTGKQLWTHRFGGDFWASPIVAEGHIYCLSQTGSVPIFKASRTFELIAENTLEAEFNASPSVAENSLILRSRTHLYRIGSAP